jgi:hypothetical protein
VSGLSLQVIKSTTRLQAWDVPLEVGVQQQAVVQPRTAHLDVFGRVNRTGASPLDTLTRGHYRPWAWAVLPLAVAVDAAIVPPLLLLAPIVMVIGD